MPWDRVHEAEVLEHYISEDLMLIAEKLRRPQPRPAWRPGPGPDLSFRTSRTPPPRSAGEGETATFGGLDSDPKMLATSRSADPARARACW